MYLELQFVLLPNHDQNNVFRSVLVLLKVVHLCKVGIELNAEKINAFRPGSINRSLGSIDRSSGRMFFCRIFQLSPSCFKTFLAFLIYPKYKRQTLATFQCCSYCDLCKTLVRSRGAFLYTNLGFSRRRFIYTLMINSVAAIET